MCIPSSCYSTCSYLLINHRSTPPDDVVQGFYGVTPEVNLCWQSFHIHSDWWAYYMCLILHWYSQGRVLKVVLTIHNSNKYIQRKIIKINVGGFVVSNVVGKILWFAIFSSVPFLNTPGPSFISRDKAMPRVFNYVKPDIMCSGLYLCKHSVGHGVLLVSSVEMFTFIARI